MSDEDLSRYQVSRDTPIEDVDLDAEVVLLPDGTRLTEALAEQMAHRYEPPEAIPMPRDATDAQLRQWAAEGDDFSRLELENRARQAKKED